MRIIIMELKLHCKENAPCQYWYKQNLHCLRQELSAPWHYHHRWRHQKSVCLCVSNHINPLLNGTWLLVMPFSPTNATCRCFSYWFLTFLLSTRCCSSTALLLTRSGVEFLNACTFSHWLLMLACHFFSSPNYFKECSTFPYNLNCTSHIVFRSATFNSCNLQQFAARYQLGLRESQLILTVRYAKNVKNKLNFNPSIILNFKKLTRPW